MLTLYTEFVFAMAVMMGLKMEDSVVPKTRREPWMPPKSATKSNRL